MSPSPRVPVRCRDPAEGWFVFGLIAHPRLIRGDGGVELGHDFLGGRVMVLSELQTRKSIWSLDDPIGGRQLVVGDRLQASQLASSYSYQTRSTGSSGSLPSFEGKPRIGAD